MQFRKNPAGYTVQPAGKRNRMLLAIEAVVPP